MSAADIIYWVGLTPACLLIGCVAVITIIDVARYLFNVIQDYFKHRE